MNVVTDEDVYVFPAAYSQRNLWFLNKIEGLESSYHLATALHVHGPLDVDLMEQGLQLVVERHETLRTTFRETNGNPEQVVHSHMACKIKRVNMQDVPVGEQEEEAKRRITMECAVPFDLEKGPLWRITVWKLQENEYVMALLMHHIIGDGWSLGVLVREVSVFYDALVKNQSLQLPELSIQYADYTLWQREWLDGGVLEEQLRYWRRQLHGAPEALQLPTDFPRLSVQTFRGERFYFRLSREVTAQLRSLVHQEGVSLFMMLFSAFVILLNRYSNEDDLCIGTPVSNRNLEDLEALIGLFVNTLVLRTNLSGQPTLREVLRRVGQVCVEGYSHADVPFEKLVEELRPKRDSSRNPLFQVLFGISPTMNRQLQSEAELQMSMMTFERNASPFDLSLEFFEQDEGMEGFFNFNTALFERKTIERMERHFQLILQQMLTDLEQPIHAIPLLNEAERTQVIELWNSTKEEYPDSLCLHRLFEQQAIKHPDRVAIECVGTQITYGELNRQADELARYLRIKGVEADVRVGLCAHRSPVMIVGLLGILKAGGAYVPIDPSLPIDRISYLLEESAMVLLLSESDVIAQLPALQLPVLALDKPIQEVVDTGRNDTDISSDSLCYCIFTSGSTGRPKGVQVTHRNVVNLLSSMQNKLQVTPDDVLLAVTTFSFDISVLELFLPLISGARTVIATREEAVDGQRLLHLLKTRGVTLFQATPSTYQLLLDVGFERHENLTLLCGGEALLWSLALQLLDRAEALWNVYGPTETTIWSTAWQVKRSDGRALIGRPLANTKVYIFDEHLRPVPPGLIGELYIGGDGVSRGYLNRPDLTAERFMEHPLVSGRIYRTGDLARFLPDGTLECLGRIDSQVKIRGYRVELSEIENRLLETEAVKECAVIAREVRHQGMQLIAYFVKREGASVSPNALKLQLQEVLPSYMVPPYLVELDALPMTPNGKIDRKALPAPVLDGHVVEGTKAEPRTTTESKVAAIWQEVLQVERIGRQDNFFELGGHSLLLVQVQKRLRETFDVEVRVIEMFKYPTVESLAAHLQVAKGIETNANLLQPRQKRQVEDRLDDIAIIGMGGRFPKSQTLEEFWQHLRNGEELITTFTDAELLANGLSPELMKNPNYVKAGAVIEDPELFDAAFFGYNPREAELMDPQHRLFLECSYEALENAGYHGDLYEGRIGVFASSAMNSYVLSQLMQNHEFMETIDPFQVMISNDKDFLATRVAYKLNLNGPSMAVQTACSSSLVALHQACQSLRQGDCDMALVGGVSVRSPQKRGYIYHEGGIMSPDGHCRAFDESAQGTVGGNGLGVIVIKRLSDALQDGDAIRAVIKGTSINNDGSNKVGFTAPSVQGQAQVILDALADAGVAPDTISYVEAHGTGTALGDPIEVEALTTAYRTATNRSGYCALGSLKTNIGHLDTAAGIAGVIKTVLALEHQEIPPSLHFHAPNSNIDFEDSPFFVNRDLQSWQASQYPRRAGVSSFGIGGTNVHVILEEAPLLDRSKSFRNKQLLTVSAKTPKALQTACHNLANYLDQHEEIPLADVAYTLLVGRVSYPYRYAVLVADRAEAIQALQQVQEQSNTVTERQGHREVVLQVGGAVGEVDVESLQVIYESEPIFRQHLDQAAASIKIEASALITSSGCEVGSKELARHAFLRDYCLTQWLISVGLHPDLLIGEGVGEKVVACVNGSLSLEEALHQLTYGDQVNDLVAVDVETVSRADVVYVQVKGGRIRVIDGEESLEDMLSTTCPLVEEMLQALQKVWLLGGKIAWTGLYQGESRKRVPLPTYPFVRQRFWVERTQKVQASRRQDPGDWFYIPSWKRSLTTNGRLESPVRYLLFMEDGRLLASVRERLVASGHEVITVRPHAEFFQFDEHSYGLPLDDKSVYERLALALSERGQLPERLVHGLNFEERCVGGEVRQWEETAKVNAFYSLIHLVQGLEKHLIQHEVSLFVLSAQLQTVAGETEVDPGKSLLIGPTKVIPQEYPNVTCISIDLQTTFRQAWQWEQQMEMLERELQVVSHEQLIVAYRQGQRFVQSFDQIRLPEGRHSVLRPQGVYLILGGLGKIGMALAGYLAEEWQARVVVVGRSTFPTPSTWEQRVRQHGEADEVSQKILRFQKWKESGAEVLVLTADLSDELQMQGVLEQIDARFGELHGVIHSAGLTGEQVHVSVHELTRELAEPNFVPKVAGLHVLERVLRGRLLDFCLVNSSLSPLLGGLGLTAYASANAYLDAFVQQMRDVSPIPWMSVNWEGWHFGKHRDEESARVTTLAEWSISPAEAVDCFQRMLVSGVPSQMIMSTGEFEHRRQQWVQPVSKSTQQEASQKTRQLYPRPHLQVAYQAPQTEKERKLVEMWQQLLGIEGIGVHDNFFELGGHSLLALQMVTQLQKTFGRSLALYELIEHNTIEDLCKLLEKVPEGEMGNVLVPIQTSGSRAPLFCIHPSGGNILCYTNLARQLGPDQPVYGLQAVGQNVEEEPLERIEEMAQRYVTEVLRVQPQGPYHLTGWSLGGTIAFEMAQVLKRLGHEVKHVSLIDSRLPQSDQQMDDNKILSLFFEELKGLLGEELPISYEQFQNQAATVQIHRMLQWAKDAGLLPEDAELAHVQRLFLVFRANLIAWSRYEPSVYPGQLILYFTEDQLEPEDGDVTRGFGALSGQLAEVQIIPGTHTLVLQEPFVMELASDLQRLLER